MAIKAREAATAGGLVRGMTRTDAICCAIRQELERQRLSIDGAINLCSLRIDVKLRGGDGQPSKVIVSGQTEQYLTS